MGRILGIGVSAFVYFSVGTTLAAAALLGYLLSQGYLSQDKLTKIVAAAKGIEPEAKVQSTTASGAESEGEQPSYDDVLLARALKVRDIELREQQIANMTAVLRADEDELFAENTRFRIMKDAFTEELKEQKSGAMSASQELLRLTLESMKPAAAKDQILRMIADNDMESVVALVSAMPTAKRTKLLAAFQTDKEIDAVAEILKLIRAGAPDVGMIDKRLDQVDQQDSGAANTP